MTGMGSWIARRILLGLPMIVSIAALTFTLVHLAPGDPITLLAGDGGSPAYYDEMRAKYGLDRPLTEQFALYLRTVLSADFGYSFMYQARVVDVLLVHLPATLLLGFAALALASVAGWGLGYVCVAQASPRVDFVIRALASITYSAPVFWTGQLLMIAVSVQLGWLPVGGMTSARTPGSGFARALDVARHLVLPAVTLALPFLAVVVRVSRASLIETLREPFMNAAYARGLSRRQLVSRHATRLAVIPVVALVGQQAAQLAAGAALTESLFGWPGVGYLILHASLHRDYPLVTAAFIVISIGVVLFNTVADAIGVWLDPRVRQA